MDLGRFSGGGAYDTQLDVEWLCDAFQQDEEELTYQLEHLKRKGLLQDVDLKFRRISMHALYLEFAKLEANGSLNESTNLRKRMWMYVDNRDLSKLESKPEGGCWHKLIRLAIIQRSLALKKHSGIVGGVGGMRGMKWDYFCNAEVLQLSGLQWRYGALNLEALMCLRILELNDVRGFDRVEGLVKVNHLTYFKWMSSQSQPGDSVSIHIVGQLPLSLKKLYIFEKDLVLESNVLAQCYNLSNVQLDFIEARTLDLSNCRSLHSVTLNYIQNLQSLLGLPISQPSNLQRLSIHYQDLVDITGIDYLIGLKKLHINVGPKFEMPNFLALTKLQELELSSEQDGLLVYAKDYIPHQLQELRWHLKQSKEGPNLTGFNHLEVFNLSFSWGLTSLVELGDLPALRHLDLQYCKHLLQLPDLSMSSNLEELKLNECFALELHEKDIQMLSKLPLLQPVPFSRWKERGRFRLDLARKKVLVNSCSDTLFNPWGVWKEDEREELDLGTPPIKIGKQGTWE